MKRWKDYNTNEKLMIGMIVMLIICVFLSWGRITKGISKGFTFLNSDSNTSVEQNDSLK